MSFEPVEEPTPPAPQPIIGYRTLTAPEISLINAVKTHGKSTENLLDAVKPVLYDSEQLRWLSIARTHLQQGYMALTRAVANPQGF